MPRATKTNGRATAFMGASLVFLFAIALVATGCSERAEPPGSDESSGVVRVDTYENILGIVATLPEAGKPGSEFKIHHEHIPDFKTKEGSVFVTADGVPGMKSMVMAFPLGGQVTLEGLEVGDKVRFSFDVNWGGSPPWVVTKIEEIDPDTEIDFANKVEGAAPSGSGNEPAGSHAGDDHDGP